MTVTFTAKTWTSVASAQTITPTEPAGAIQDDVLLMLVVIQSTFSSFVGPTGGWTQIVDLTNGGGGAGQNFGAYLYWIRRGASAPGYAVSWTTNRFCEVSVTGWRGGIVTGNPYDALTSRYRGSINPAAPDTQSVNTTVVNDEVVSLGVSWTGCTTAFTPPAGYTIRDAGTPGQAIGVASKLVASITSEDPGVFGDVAAGANGVGEITISLSPSVRRWILGTH